MISEQKVSNSLPLTTAQQLIWTGQKLRPQVPLYNMALAYTIDGEIDASRLRRALQLLVDHCDSLRTVFEEVDGEVRQRILDHLSVQVNVIDFTTGAKPADDFATWAAQWCQQNFDLSKRTFDTALARLDQRRFVWLYNQHHIATDASSFALIFRRVGEIYDSLAGGDARPTSLTSFPQYSDYVEFERENRARIDEAREWFASRTHRQPPALYGISSAVNKNTTSTRRVTLRPSLELVARFRDLAMQPGIRGLTRHASQFQLVATVIFSLLYRVSGQRELAIGSPAHNRVSRKFRDSIGLFIEVFPLSIEIDTGETFLSLLEKVKTETMSFVRFAQPGASTNRDQRCFNTLLNYITAGFGDFCHCPTSSEWLHAGHCDGGHLLRVQVHDFDDSGQIVFHFDLNNQFFDTALEGSILHHFQQLLEAAIDNLEQKIDAVPLLASMENESSVACKAPSRVARPTVVERFEDVVERLPGETAILCGSHTITYADLGRRVDRLAEQLGKLGCGPDDMVAIFLPRSSAAIVSMLAALKLGASYVPIDSRTPPRRVEFVLNDAANPLVVTSAELATKLPRNARRMCVDATGQPADIGEVHSHAPATRGASVTNAAKPDRTAYVIYTSGSTGQPKGVVVTHANLSHYVSWASDFYAKSDRLSFPLFSPLAFDLTVTSIFVPLVTGGRIVVYPESRTGADLALLDVLESDLVDIIKLTPSHLSLLLGRKCHGSRVRQLILGGEDLRCDVAREALQVFGKTVKVHNEYGPTEATVGCIVHTFDPSKDQRGSVPIGRPIRDMQAYVLNDELQMMPHGVIGDLYVAGDGLTNGYWNRAELTRNRFVPTPWDPDESMYRTGDLARVRTDGTFEYLGRTDEQVKIRGARIELGEVESAVASHPLVEECVVTVTGRQTQLRSAAEPLFHCVRCGLPSNYPEASFDEKGVCRLCRSYDVYKDRAQRYFRSMEELEQLFASARHRREGPVGEENQYDCVSLLSGGKDSTYALGRLVDMGLKVLAFTLDNGYISDDAKANIDRVVQTLDVDHIYGSTPAMNAIFVDSLQRHANVCQGCFKTIYTLSMQLAREKGIPYIVTGLSRGQFFETRLTEELFTDPNMDPDDIDQTILRARKEYHRVDDAVSKSLDVECFRDDAIFEQVQFVDFYRYCDVSLEEMLTYLRQRLPWIRPSDTGRSTNCLINDVGIFVHQRDRGFHNYALPYSWDVRMGHKERNAALEELDDQIDKQRVQEILSEIGYVDSGGKNDHHRLAAYYVSNVALTRKEFVSHLSGELSDFMIPTHFVRLDAIPLTGNGKVDRRALPNVSENRPDLEETYEPPANDTERLLAQVWQDVLRVERVGAHDNFFDLGGDSIIAIQITARANKVGLQIAATELFDTLTIRRLAQATGKHEIWAEQGTVTGSAPMTPIQHWYFGDLLTKEKKSRHSHRLPPAVSQVYCLKLNVLPDVARLLTAFRKVVAHHDALSVRYRMEDGVWTATHQSHPAAPDTFAVVDVGSFSPFDREVAVRDTVERLHSAHDLAAGKLISAALLQDGPESGELILVAHHLVVDAASWPILADDLALAYEQLLQGQTIQLPIKTTSMQQWSQTLLRRSATEPVIGDQRYWMQVAQHDVAYELVDWDRRECELVRWLDAAATTTLLDELPALNRRVHEVLLTAIALTLSEWTSQKVVGLDVEGHGRELISKKVDVSRTVGWFTSLYPVRLELPGDSAVNRSGAYEAVREQLAQIPSNGLSYGLLRYLGGIEQLDTSHPVLFNFLGHAERLVPPSSLFSFSRPIAVKRDPGARRHAIEINAIVVAGRLQLTWTFGEANQAAVTDLADRFDRTLMALLSDLMRATRSGASPADFPQAKLNLKRFGKLSAALGKVDSRDGHS